MCQYTSSISSPYVPFIYENSIALLSLMHNLHSQDTLSIPLFLDIFQGFAAAPLGIFYDLYSRSPLGYPLRIGESQFFQE